MFITGRNPYNHRKGSKQQGKNGFVYNTIQYKFHRFCHKSWKLSVVTTTLWYKNCDEQKNMHIANLFD